MKQLFRLKNNLLDFISWIKLQAHRKDRMSSVGMYELFFNFNKHYPKPPTKETIRKREQEASKKILSQILEEVSNVKNQCAVCTIESQQNDFTGSNKESKTEPHP